MKFQKRRFSYWGAFAILLVLLSLLLVYCQTQEQKNVYQEDPTATSATEATSPDNNIALVTHKNKTLNASYGIPEDWQAVTLKGCETYIHRASGASVQIQLGKYDPVYTTMTLNSVQNALFSRGATVHSFQWVTNTSNMTIYQIGDNTNGAIYVEHLSFDKENAVNFTLTWPMKYYDRLKDTMTAIMDSFKWEKEKPYPTDVVIAYNSVANCEFVYPASWNAGIQNNVYFVQENISGGTIMSVTINPSTTSYDGVSELDYTKWASSGRNRFVLQDCQISANRLYATSTFSANNSTYVLIQYMYASGTYEYILTFEVPYAGYTTERIQLIEQLINSLTIFKMEE